MKLIIIRGIEKYTVPSTKHQCERCGQVNSVPYGLWQTDVCGACGNNRINIIDDQGNYLGVSEARGTGGIGEVSLWVADEWKLDILTDTGVNQTTNSGNTQPDTTDISVIKSVMKGTAYCCDICQQPNDWVSGPFRCYQCTQDPLGRISKIEPEDD